MRCPRCQQRNPAGARFCNGCGARLELSCPSCQGANAPDGQFCIHCGYRLRASPDRAARDAERAPSTYTPPHLAERILTARAAVEGERKQVTVLFADMRGSMEVLAGRDPEEWREILDHVLARMMEAVHRYEGTVNQVMGDGIMALFGAPLAHEDHAARACYAALHMQDAVRRYAERAGHDRDIAIQIRVGLNSGEVIVRSIGNDLHTDYTAVGQPTHLAARMEQLVAPGSILLTSEVMRLAQGLVEARPLGPVSVKGITHPIELFELAGAGPARSRFQALALRGLTAFVGRAAELAQLGQALGRARAGHGQVVAVVGEPGVGKSRLVHELVHSSRTRGWLILEASALSYGRATSYLPVIDLLKRYFQIASGEDPPAAVRQRVVDALEGLGPHCQALLPALLALLDLPAGDRQWEQLDPQQRRQRTLEAVKRLFISQPRPLLLIVEDLQWIDTETQAVLDGLVDGLPAARFCLLVNYRPEYAHAWGSRTYYRLLRIDPLEVEQADELLNVLLGPDPTLTPLRQLLIEQTEGNPFFLEESVRTLVETGALVGDAGVYRLATDVKAIRVAPTINAVLAARIDRLSPAEKGLLQCAAVVGRDVPLTILSAIADQPEDVVQKGLAALRATEFLYEASLFPDLRYTFKHSLTHEVAYGTLVHSRRRALHARIVEAIEGLHADRLAEQLEPLAHHALRGEVWDKASSYCAQAGAKAAGRSANREAVAAFENALLALRHLPQTPTAVEQAIDLRLSLRNAFLQLGEPGPLITYLREAEAFAQQLGDGPRLGRVQASMAHYFWLTGEHARALEFGESARATAMSLGDVALEVTTNYYLGLASHAVGDFGRGAEILRRNVDLLGGGLLHERFGTAGFHSVFARGWLACCLAELGEFREGRARGEEGARIAEAVGEPFSLIQAYLGIGNVYLGMGDCERAVGRLETALTVCREAGIRVLFPRIASSLGQGYALLGRVGEALPLLEQAVEQAFSMPVVFMQASALIRLADGYLACGRPEDAKSRARRALAHARQHGERGNEAWAQWLVARIAARGDPPRVDDADGGYRGALARAEALGMRPLVAHCHLGLGVLGKGSDRSEDAERNLRAAAELYGDMGMGFWLRQIEHAWSERGVAGEHTPGQAPGS